MARYLDRNDRYFSGPRVALTVLSRHFYIPSMTSAEIREHALGGRPLYYLVGEDGPDRRVKEKMRGHWRPVYDFDYQSRRLFRWEPGPAGEEM